MYTPLYLYFLTCIVALWRSGENIASIVRILHTVEQKTTQQTSRRFKKKKQVSRAVSASLLPFSSTLSRKSLC